MSKLHIIEAACCAPGAPLMDLAAAARLAMQFRALADPTRVAIVNRLAGAGEVCVCDLTEAFELGQPTISHHLKVLRQAGLVSVERRGKWAYYCLEPAAIGQLAGALQPAPR